MVQAKSPAARRPPKRRVPAPRSVVIDDAVFQALIAQRAPRLLRPASYLAQRRAHAVEPTRPLLGELMSQAVQFEELLDAYGAGNNRRWSRLRSVTAAIKLFANVSYKLRHIQHTMPSYRLLPIEHDFVAATGATLTFTCDVLVEAASRFVEHYRKLGLTVPAQPPADGDYAEFLPPGRLPRDRAARRVKSAAETVTHLATAFLNLAADSELLHKVVRSETMEYEHCFPDLVSEEKLRYLKFRFHNLQSLYDTYVSETKVEQLDTDLPVLRGHASVVFHLLEIATELAHYYERHANPGTGDSFLRRRPIVEPSALVGALMNYPVAFASHYVASGQRLCRRMLKRYAEIERIEAPVPSYRGFHVRPATLVAKIVSHYGSEVRMELNGERYDAGSPLDFFRANEQINAYKRRWLAAQIAQLPLAEHPPEGVALKTLVRRVVVRLAEENKLIVYQQPLQFAAELASSGSMLERINAEIARLLATGQIDIKIDMTIAFIGDKRVLADILLLARNGYGEDRFGNNIPLPKDLTYLRR